MARANASIAPLVFPIHAVTLPAVLLVTLMNADLLCGPPVSQNVLNYTSGIKHSLHNLYFFNRD